MGFFNKKSSLLKEKERAYKQQAQLAAVEERGKQRVRLATELEKIKAQSRLAAAKQGRSSFGGGLQKFAKGLDALTASTRKPKGKSTLNKIDDMLR